MGDAVPTRLAAMVSRCPHARHDAAGASSAEETVVNNSFVTLVIKPVCREVGDLPWVRIPPGQSVARPEADSFLLLAAGRSLQTQCSRPRMVPTIKFGSRQCRIAHDVW